MTDLDLQEKCRRLVAREVYHCASALIHELAQDEKYMDELLEICAHYPEVATPDQYRYIVDLDERGEYRATVYEIDEDGDDVERWTVTGEMLAEGGELEGIAKDDPEAIVNEILEIHFPERSYADRVLDETDDPETEPSDDPVEALEHWIISDWLARWLEDKGEMITFDFMGLTIWGRTCSGQAIYCDGVIEEIVKDLERKCAIV